MTPQPCISSKKGLWCAIVSEEPATRPDPRLGQIIDNRYRLNEVIGRGGMGIVYRATQLRVGREVAVKVMSGACTETQIARFQRETDVVAKLRHPNTLTLFDAGATEDGQRFLVSELLRGQTLLDVLQNGPLGLQRSLRVARDICNSLSEAHALGIVHRDLKPANIFLVRVGNEEVAKVLDFGIASVLNETSELTAEGRRIGTPAYMSPEQVTGRKLDGRSDLYALGVIIYRCLSGTHPFPEAESYPQAHLHDTPTSLRHAARMQIPEALEALLMQLLEKSPNDRVSTADELARHIDELLNAPVPVTEDPGTLTGEAEVIEPTRPWPKVAAGLLLASGIGMGAWGWSQSAGHQGPYRAQLIAVVPARLHPTMVDHEDKVIEVTQTCAEQAQITVPATIRVMVQGTENWVVVRPKGAPADQLRACLQAVPDLFAPSSDELMVLTLTVR